MRTLYDALSRCDTQQLDVLLRLWAITPDPTLPLERQRDLLLKRLASPIAARCVWEHLTQAERLILFHACSTQARDGIEPTTLMKKAGLDEAAFVPALERLTALLLLAETTADMEHRKLARPRAAYDNIHAIPVVALYLQYQEALVVVGRELFGDADRASLPLVKLLKGLLEATLFRMCQHYQLDMTSFYTFTDRRNVLAEELAQPRVVCDSLSRLDKTLRNSFLWLCQQGGRAPMEAVRMRGYADSALFTLIQMLGDFGLGFTTLTAKGEHMLFVPLAIYEQVQRDLGSTGEGTQQQSTILATAPPTFAGETRLLYDLAVIVWASQQLTAEQTAQFRLTKKAEAKLRPLTQGLPRLGEDREDEYVEMLFRVAESLRLITWQRSPTTGKVTCIPGSGQDQCAHLDQQEQAARLFSWYEQSSVWQDSLGSRFRQWEPSGFTPLAARPTLLRSLRECRPGVWYSVDALLERIWQDDPYALHPSYGNRTMKLRVPAAMKPKWESCEAVVYQGVLLSLYELGLISLGYMRPGGCAPPLAPEAFQLTDLGAALLTKQHAAPKILAAPTGSSGLIVQPNFQLLLLHYDPAILFAVLPFVEVNRIGVVCQLTLTREAVLRAIERGMTVDAMISRLEASPKGLPQNIGYTLREWVRGYKSATLAHVLLIEVEDETVADELCVSPKLAAFGLRRIGPCAIVVGGTQRDQEVRRALEKLGIAVQVLSAAPAVKAAPPRKRRWW